MTDDEKVLPWVEKYRPVELDGVIGQSHVVSILRRLLAHPQQCPHVLLHGPPGSGKTSIAHASLHHIFGTTNAGKSRMILELNASDERGIHVVQGRIKEFVERDLCQRSSFPFKCVVLDEADNMTDEAQFALRQVIEKHTASVRFFLLCNYVNDVIPALRSRCVNFRVGPVASDAASAWLQTIFDQESLTYTEPGLQALLEVTNGDLRRTLNLAQTIQLSRACVTPTCVYAWAHVPSPEDVTQVMQSLWKDPFTQCYRGVARMQSQQGIALKDLLEYIGQRLSRSVPVSVRAGLLSQLSDMQYDLQRGCSEQIQLGKLVGLFLCCRP